MGGRVGRHPARIYSRWDMGNGRVSLIFPLPRRERMKVRVKPESIPLTLTLSLQGREDSKNQISKGKMTNQKSKRGGNKFLYFYLSFLIFNF
jgi:hypothetical protein